MASQSGQPALEIYKGVGNGHPMASGLTLPALIGGTLGNPAFLDQSVSNLLGMSSHGCEGHASTEPASTSLREATPEGC